MGGPRPGTSPRRRPATQPGGRRKSAPSIRRALVPYSRSPVILKKEFPSRKIGRDNKVFVARAVVMVLLVGEGRGGLGGKGEL